MLEALLGDDLDVVTAESLVDHLTECPACRAALLEMSVDKDDWKIWESVLKTPKLSWPSVASVDKNLSSAHLGQAAAAHGLSLTVGLPGSPSTGDTTQFAGAREFNNRADSTSIVRDRSIDTENPGVFGDYELLEKVGAGGMGVVFRARQNSTDRLVALKLIRPEQLESLPSHRRDAWLSRFRVEAQTAARLEHDHLVTIYDVGQSAGVLYYSMQYIEGPSLDQVVRDGPMDNHRAATLVRSVALAVDYAHRQGILHRDLKPHNILVRQGEQGTAADSSKLDSKSSAATGEALSSERAFVADFGLAKYLGEGREAATHTGEVMGSPSYMSPEQAQDASRCTPASDIYGLGATLYELLTGRPPFRGVSALETLRQVIEQEPVAPRDLNSGVDLDLETITLKALAKEPSRRYTSAAQMADDLQRYLQAEPIEARPIGRGERALRWCRRNPVVASLVCGIAALLLVVAVVSAGYSVRLSQHAHRESSAREEAESYFRMTLNVIDEMLTEFGDESLAHVPHMEHARKELLRKALALHEQLLAAKPTNRALRIEFARAQRRIGDLYDLLGEHDDAKAAYAESIRLFDDLRRERPESRQLIHDLSVSYTMLGETLRKTSPHDARRNYEIALSFQTELQRMDPTNLTFTKERSRTLNNLGLLLTETGQFAEAKTALSDAVEQLKQLSESVENAPNILSDLGRSQINLGVLLRKIPTLAASSETVYRDAIRNLQRAVELDQQNREYRFRLAVAMVDLANFFLTEAPHGVEQALELTSEARDRFLRLQDDFPGIPIYQYELANAHSSLAIACAMLNRTDDARTEFDQASRALDELANGFPDYTETVPKHASLKGRVLGGVGYLQTLAGKWEAARGSINQAIACQQKAVRLSPENPDFVEYLSEHHAFLASILGELSLSRQAEKHKDSSESYARQAAEMKARRILTKDQI